MSAVLKRDDHGVLLRYAEPSILCPHHVESRPHPGDRERVAILEAERACLTILIIGEHVLSEIAMTRLLDELRAIQRALDLKRSRLGMSAQAEVAA
jgi:hypothetical protein